MPLTLDELRVLLAVLQIAHDQILEAVTAVSGVEPSAAAEIGRAREA